MVDDEQAELEAQLEQLSNVELIKEQLEKSISLADSEQFGLLVNIKEFKNAIQRISSYSKEYAQLFERVESLLIELKDIVNELNSFSESVVNDPEQLILVNQKLQTIYNLQKKHQVNSVEELLQIQNDLEGKVISVTSLENEIAEIQIRLEKYEVDLNELAILIHSNRAKSIPKLSDMLQGILSQLGMPNVQFKIKVELSETFLPMEKIRFNFLFPPIKVPISGY
uniref:hypothetical protein n=1 Tax=Flavobacterium piscinae TaxID=2506424 RepID=UPI0037098562